MKVSLITYHRAYNYGATLQTYATVSFLCDLGYEVEVIDYIPQKEKNYGSFKQAYNESRMFHSNKFLCAGIAILNLPTHKKQRRVFDEYTDKMLPLSKSYYSINELEEDCPVADIYCTGSDQVWNNTYLLNKKFDFVYFLGFVKNKKKIALSASFGRKDFSVEELQEIKPYLNEYSAISVRETSGLDLLSEVDVPLKDVILDPTLLIDKSHWSEQFVNNNEQNYILVYEIHGTKIIYNQACKLAEKLNKRVISIEAGRYKKRKGLYFIPTLNQFLTLINGADIVMTNSFHGVAFSTNFNKNFIAYNAGKTNERIVSLLNLLGLNNRIANSFEEITKLAQTTIDYEHVNSVLNDERVRAREFWKQAIKL